MKELFNEKVQHAIEVMILDVLIINVAYMAAVLLLNNFNIASLGMCMWQTWPFWLINSAISLTIFNVYNMYNIIWRYISFNEGMRAAMGVTVSFAVNVVIGNISGNGFTASEYIVAYAIALLGILGIRFGFRWIFKVYMSKHGINSEATHKNVMVVGAGEAGRMLIKDIQSSMRLNMDVCCVIDDNEGIKGRLIEGVPIVGGRRRIPVCVEKYEIDTILIAIPSASPQNRKDILEICKHTKCELKILPGMYQLVSGTVSASNLRDVDIEDLLGRDPIVVNTDEIMDYVANKTVLVTGGGGSIGSELCRQIAAHGPKQLVILDIYENSTYEIQQELIRTYEDLQLKVIIASVRDESNVERIFAENKPDIVFHAAAHKHVPLMEEVPCEAIKNNVFGTYNVAKAAIKYNAERFVLISTDKAVNPTNIMGASKRLCEMIVQMLAKTTDNTKLAAVRFGNVLGSNGSVIPLFKKQIEEGGPVTVTHPEIIRYFMTIPEAVSLVLQAGAYAKGGEIFILDMGAPVKIDDLARNLIRLSGYVPDIDIEIKYTGLRPGEKLYEELLMDEEGKKKTTNNLIYIGKPIEMDEEEFKKKIQMLYEKAENNSADIKDVVASIVPTYNRRK